MIHTCPGRARLGCPTRLCALTFLDLQWIFSVLQNINYEVIPTQILLDP